jgi:hypothetical protein
MAAVATRLAGHRCISAVHVPPRRASLIRGRRRSPRGIPTLAALGKSSHVHATRSPEEKKKGERRGDPEASHKYTDAAVKTLRPPVGFQDVEEL